MVKRLLYLNGLAILAVILFHSAGWGFTAMFSWAHRYLPAGVNSFSQIGTPAYYILRAIEQMAIFSIPAFLFVSGFFVAFKSSAEPGSNPWRSIATRIKFLAIPYLIWTTFYMFLNLILGVRPKPLEIAISYLTGSINPAYYFVILLIQFYLLSPWLVNLARTNWKLLLVLTLCIQLLVDCIPYLAAGFSTSTQIVGYYKMLPKWLFLSRIFWFSLGIIIGIHRNQFSAFLRLRHKWWGWMTIAFYLLSLVERELLLQWSGSDWVGTRETPINALYTISLLFMFLSSNSTLWKKNNIEKIGGQSFGIYLVHIPVMELIARSIYHLFPQFLSHTFLFVLLIAITGLFIPILIMKLIKISPIKATYGYLFG